MLSTFLFLVLFSLYAWLYYKPKSAAIAATSSLTAKLKPTVQIVDKRTPIPEQSLSVIAEEKLPVKTAPATIGDTSPKPELVEAVEDLLSEEHPPGEDTLSHSELKLDADTELEPALTEEEAIALAIETTLAKDTEDSIPDLIRPKPPEPELIEAAVRDAEEKSEDFSPPEIVDDAQVRVGI